jgi:hypothetical protein
MFILKESEPHQIESPNKKCTAREIAAAKINDFRCSPIQPKYAAASAVPATDLVH